MKSEGWGKGFDERWPSGVREGRKGVHLHTHSCVVSFTSIHARHLHCDARAAYSIADA